MPIKELIILCVGYPIGALIGMSIMVRLIRSNRILRKFVKELIK